MMVPQSEDTPDQLEAISTLLQLQNLKGSCSSDTSLIKMSEGYNNCMYHDTKGIPTVCYGYNLKNGNAKQ